MLKSLTYMYSGYFIKFQQNLFRSTLVLAKTFIHRTLGSYYRGYYQNRMSFLQRFITFCVEHHVYNHLKYHMLNVKCTAL